MAFLAAIGGIFAIVCIIVFGVYVFFARMDRWD